MLSYIYYKGLNTAIGFRLGFSNSLSQKSINLKYDLVICFADNDDYFNSVNKELLNKSKAFLNLLPPS